MGMLKHVALQVMCSKISPLLFVLTFFLLGVANTQRALPQSLTAPNFNFY